MGIDPGTNFMGYAIIKVFGKNQKPQKNQYHKHTKNTNPNHKK